MSEGRAISRGSRDDCQFDHRGIDAIELSGVELGAAAIEERDGVVRARRPCGEKSERFGKGGVRFRHPPQLPQCLGEVGQRPGEATALRLAKDLHRLAMARFGEIGATALHGDTGEVAQDDSAATRTRGPAGGERLLQEAFAGEEVAALQLFDREVVEDARQGRRVA